MNTFTLSFAVFPLGLPKDFNPLLLRLIYGFFRGFGVFKSSTQNSRQNVFSEYPSDVCQLEIPVPVKRSTWINQSPAFVPPYSPNPPPKKLKDVMTKNRSGGCWKMGRHHGSPCYVPCPRGCLQFFWPFGLAGFTGSFLLVGA